MKLVVAILFVLVLIGIPTLDLDLFCKYYPHSWRRQIAKIEQRVDGSQAVIAWIGDSWTANDAITAPVRRYLQDRFGNAGAGYITLTSRETTIGSPVTTAGTWAETSGSPSSLGVDIADVTSSDTATPASKILTSMATSFVIHYVVKSGGGSFTYAVDGGTPTAINTAAAATRYATHGISGLSSGSHMLTLTVANAGSAGVTLLGVDCVRSNNGVRMERLGNPGTEVDTWTAVNAVTWEAGISALNPDIVVIAAFGTNESSDRDHHPPSKFRSDLTQLANRVRTAVPHADIVFLSPADNGLPGKIYTMNQYATAMHDVARVQCAGFIDIYPTVGPYSVAKIQGLYANEAHLNERGGLSVANVVNAYLAGE